MNYEPGSILMGKYRLEALVGQGAFAEVYQATHLSLNAFRALKVLRRDAPGLGSTEYSDFRQRFQLEAQLGAQLDHPNIIRIYDFEQYNGTLLLVMAYAAGGSLTERLATLRKADELMPVEEAMRIALEIAQGLAALHALDVVHRDLKPSNVLFDAEGRAKVADFGLAQISHGPSMRSQLSQPLPHPGTPAYMSPEQQATGSYLTPASDIYTLGAITFEMLVGRVYRNVRPGVSLQDLRSDTPLWLDEVLTQMLAEKPESRPWDGAEAVALLNTRKQQTSPVSPPPDVLPLEGPEPEIAAESEPAGDPEPGTARPLLSRWAPVLGVILLLMVLGIGLALILLESGNRDGVGARATTTPEIPSSSPAAPGASIAEEPEPAAAGTESVSIQIALDAGGNVSLNVAQPYVSPVDTLEADADWTFDSVQQEVAGRLLLVWVDGRITVYRLANEPQFKIEVAENAAYQVESLTYDPNGDILLEVEGMALPAPTQATPSGEFAVALCTAADFDGIGCRSTTRTFSRSTESVYATWQSATALAARTAFTRRWYKDGILLLESVHNAGQNERWTPGDGISYYVYLSAREGTGRTLFDAPFLPDGRYKFELLANGRLVDVVEFEIQ